MKRVEVEEGPASVKSRPKYCPHLGRRQGDVAPEDGSSSSRNSWSEGEEIMDVGNPKRGLECEKCWGGWDLRGIDDPKLPR